MSLSLAEVQDRKGITQLINEIVDLVNKLKSCKTTVPLDHKDGDSYYLLKLSDATNVSVDLLAIRLNTNDAVALSKSRAPVVTPPVAKTPTVKAPVVTTPALEPSPLATAIPMNPRRNRPYMRQANMPVLPDRQHRPY